MTLPQDINTPPALKDWPGGSKQMVALSANTPHKLPKVRTLKHNKRWPHAPATFAPLRDHLVQNVTKIDSCCLNLG